MVDSTTSGQYVDFSASQATSRTMDRASFHVTSHVPVEDRVEFIEIYYKVIKRLRIENGLKIITQNSRDNPNTTLRSQIYIRAQLRWSGYRNDSLPDGICIPK